MSEDILSYIVMSGVFLGGMIPLIGLLLYYLKENRRLDSEAHKKI